MKYQTVKKTSVLRLQVIGLTRMFATSMAGKGYPNAAGGERRDHLSRTAPLMAAAFSRTHVAWMPAPSEAGAQRSRRRAAMSREDSFS